MKHIFSVDLEDWEHIHYLKGDRGNLSKVLSNTVRLLDTLDKYNVKATFFVVGEVAENYPELLQVLHEKGHEIGFHTYRHIPLWNSCPSRLREEIMLFKKLIKDIIGGEVLGFRAPLFSLDDSTNWAIGVLKEQGFLYDSSIFPAKTNIYGVPNASRKPYWISEEDILGGSAEGSLVELPLLVYKFLAFRIPAAGGFYIRLLPLSLFKKALERSEKEGSPATIYIHPRDIDQNPPRLNIGLFGRFVVYHNTRGALGKVETLLSEYSFGRAIDFVEKFIGG